MITPGCSVYGSSECAGGGMDYRRRVVDDELDQRTPGIAAIAIEGAKAVGKTATATQRATPILRLVDPDQRQVVEADKSRLVGGDRPILIDEWQRIPASWDVVRRAVDADTTGGQFLLTGSATPPAAPAPSHAPRDLTE